METKQIEIYPYGIMTFPRLVEDYKNRYWKDYQVLASEGKLDQYLQNAVASAYNQKTGGHRIWMPENPNFRNFFQKLQLSDIVPFLRTVDANLEKAPSRLLTNYYDDYNGGDGSDGRDPRYYYYYNNNDFYHPHRHERHGYGYFDNYRDNDHYYRNDHYYNPESLLSYQNQQYYNHDNHCPHCRQKFKHYYRN
jgi:hypothetical protein